MKKFSEFVSMLWGDVTQTPEEALVQKVYLLVDKAYGI